MGYLALLQQLVDKADDAPVREDRTGVGTYSLFGPQVVYELDQGFPLLTTKHMWWRGIVEELLWMIRGSTDNNELREKSVGIWDEWADKKGQLGPIYGRQWRAWEGVEGHIDQLAILVKNLRERPNDRGHIVSAWNVADLDRMALRPCHTMFQMYVDDGKLSCKLYQRSADIFLGVPFNMASYALLTHLIAREVGLGVGQFIHSFGDLHLYSNHLEQAREQLTREPHPWPALEILGGDLFDTAFSDLKLIDYQYHPALKGDVAV
jgi:thymidylate synthase